MKKSTTAALSAGILSISMLFASTAFAASGSSGNSANSTTTNAASTSSGHTSPVVTESAHPSLVLGTQALSPNSTNRQQVPEWSLARGSSETYYGYEFTPSTTGYVTFEFVQSSTGNTSGTYDVLDESGGSTPPPITVGGNQTSDYYVDFYCYAGQTYAPYVKNSGTGTLSGNGYIFYS